MTEIQADSTLPRSATPRGTTAVATRADVVAGGRRAAVQAWLLGHPDFLLAIALAAFLRLWHIEATQFLVDQAAMMQLARGAFLYNALPVTGIPSSIGTLNPPVSDYLLMPFTLFSANPLPIVIFIALWNVAGVGLCYIFTERYFGRWAAATAALLFATCGSAINYSRFLWPPNYLPPLLALWAITLFLGCISGRRGWFVPHVALLVVAVQLHPTTLLLVPVSIVGLLLAPTSARPSRRAYVIGAGILVVLFLPTLIWQLVNNGSDLTGLAQNFLVGGSQTNLEVFHYLFRALGTLSPSDFGPASPLASQARWYPVLSAGTTILFVLGIIVLTIRVFAPTRAIWQSNRALIGATPVDRLCKGVLDLWHGLRADGTWRANLLLWLAVIVPVDLLVRHSNTLTVHYLIIIYPSAFIVAGIGIQSLVGWARARYTTMSSRSIFARLTPIAAGAVLTLIVVIQSALWLSYPATLTSGQFDAFNGYGYPLGEVQQADAALATLQHQQKATSMEISLPRDVRYRAPLDYLLVSEHPDRIDFTSDCLVLPAVQSSPSLLVTTQPAGLAGDLATKLPNARHIANIDIPGSASWNVYTVTGTTPTLADEHALATPTDFVDAAGNGLRLEAFSTAASGLVRLRWTVLGSANRPSGTPWYRIQPSLPSESGTASTLPLANTDCQPTQWQAGETVFTWVALPNSQAAPASVALLVRSGTLAPRLATFGPIRLLASRSGSEGLSTLTPTAGEKTADGALVLPLGVVGLP